MKYFCSLFLITTMVGLTAQQKQEDVKIIAGSMVNFKKADLLKNIVGSDDSGFYVHYTNPYYWDDGTTNYYLRKFGYDLNVINEQKLNQKINRNRTYSHEVFSVKNKVFQFATTSNELDYKSVIYLQQINTDDLSFEDARKIITVRSESFSPGEDVSVYKSKDDSYVALVYKIPTTKFKSRQYAAFIFNDQMEFVWNRNFEFPSYKEKLEFDDFTLDNDGNLHLLAKRVFTDEENTYYNKEINRDVRHDFIYFDLRQDGTIGANEINGENKFIHDVKIIHTADGESIGMGFYSNVDDKSTGGVFQMKLKGENTESSYTKIDRSFFISSLTEKEVANLKHRREQGGAVGVGQRRHLPDYSVVKLVTRSNGSIQMIGEQRLNYLTDILGIPFTPHATSLIPESNGGISHHHWDDLAIVQFNTEGGLDWIQPLEKRQRTKNDEAIFSSISVLQRNEGLELLFVDNPKDLVGKVVLKGIDNSGAIHGGSDIGSIRSQLNLQPRIYRQLNENSILVSRLYGKKNGFALFTFKK